MPEASTAAGSAGGSPAGSSPRSLAEALRARDDAALAALLRARPDLLGPVPGDVTQLATRAGTRASVVRALDRLDRFALQTAEALAVGPDPCPYAVLEGLLTGGEDERARAALPDAVATLRDQALVWGDEDRLRLVRTARELLALGLPPFPDRAGSDRRRGHGRDVADPGAGDRGGRRAARHP